MGGEKSLAEAGSKCERIRGPNQVHQSNHQRYRRQKHKKTSSMCKSPKEGGSMFTNGTIPRISHDSGKKSFSTPALAPRYMERDPNQFSDEPFNFS
mmetsp:Transcript_60573/g.179549  ORF Transcript_60573/g.179549 Transcript_60573/m.179549 type:complete len:96 (+) Transcript_60573:986-1273(+)